MPSDPGQPEPDNTDDTGRRNRLRSLIGLTERALELSRGDAQNPQLEALRQALRDRLDQLRDMVDDSTTEVSLLRSQLAGIQKDAIQIPGFYETRPPRGNPESDLHRKVAQRIAQLTETEEPVRLRMVKMAEADSIFVRDWQLLAFDSSSNQPSEQASIDDLLRRHARLVREIEEDTSTELAVRAFEDGGDQAIRAREVRQSLDDSLVELLLRIGPPPEGTGDQRLTPANSGGGAEG